MIKWPLSWRCPKRRRTVLVGCVYCTQWGEERHDPWCPRWEEQAS